MACDLMGDIELTVSDKRESIIRNLEARFQEAGIKKYKRFVADLSGPNVNFKPGEFDVVIADVPCSGSGTWARTPEQLCFFTADKVGYYSNLQKSILSNVARAVKKGGMMIYITCSVFKNENEDMLNFLSTLGFQNKYSQLFKGYEEDADTLFGALLTNSSA